MSLPFPSSGLYAITDSSIWPGSGLVSAVTLAIEGGARVIQYREKTQTPELGLLKDLAALCRSCEVPLIVNDDIELAARIDADGVHLGRGDPSIVEARRLLGKQTIVGISCYDSVSRAVQAEAEGADYVAFGSFFPSRTKPEASPVRMDILKQVSLSIPVVAIGGITPENGKTLLDSGADLLAVISGIFGQADPKQAALAYRRLFDDQN